MVSPSEVMKLVNARVTRILHIAETGLPASQFQAYRKLVLDEFGRNGFVRDLERLVGQGAGEGRDG